MIHPETQNLAIKDYIFLDYPARVWFGAITAPLHNLY